MILVAVGDSFHSWATWLFFLKACSPQEITCIYMCSSMNWNIVHHQLDCMLLNQIQFVGGRPNVGVFLVTSMVFTKLNNFFDDTSHYIGVAMLHVDAIPWHLLEFECKPFLASVLYFPLGNSLCKLHGCFISLLLHMLECLPSIWKIHHHAPIYDADATSKTADKVE